MGGCAMTKLECLKKELRITSITENLYYYSFDNTGVFEVNKILHAVACAGNAFHHTDQWQDEALVCYGHKGRTPEQWIQNAANDAARSLSFSKWISVKDRLPEHTAHIGGKPPAGVIVCANGSVWDGQYIDGEWKIAGVSVAKEMVSHWMPYPDSPSEE
jgi:hypothetical protein